MARRITAAALILLGACSGVRTYFGAGGKALSYAQYHSLEEGLTAPSVLRAFGGPVHSLEEDGKVRGLTYLCEDSTGEPTILRLAFDEEERLRGWALGSETGRKGAPGPSQGVSGAHTP